MSEEASFKTRGEKFEKGLATRRAVLGPDYVDNNINNADEFTWPMQKLVTEFCWDEIWNRPGLDRRSRSVLNLGMISALNRPHELKVHIRGAIANGLSKAEIRRSCCRSRAIAACPPVSMVSASPARCSRK